MKIIYNLENRGTNIIGHFFFFMIAGMVDIEQKTIINIGPDSDTRRCDKSFFINWNIDINNVNQYKLEYPLLINYTGEQFQYHKELFDIIKDKFTLISDDINNYKTPEYRIINNYGAHTDIPDKYIHYVRKLILERVNKPYQHTNKFYISRNKAMSCENSPSQQYGRLRRTVINEKELLKVIEPMGYKRVYMEDLLMKEKIELFNSADTIIGPFGGGFTCSLFANKQTKIIELLPYNPSQYCDQFKHICNVLNINFTRFSNVSKDNDDNMIVNINELIKLL
jgi:capsular polysaccharide biosynthesis protein